jgi:hypothetical protein
MGTLLLTKPTVTDQDALDQIEAKATTLGRLFDKRSPAAATLFNLAQCVGLTFELK